MDLGIGFPAIEFIRGANPFVIIDEPQSVDTTPKSRRAIAQLNPAATLRYSATHRNPYGLLYKLGPIEAYDMRLVKRDRGGVDQGRRRLRGGLCEAPRNRQRNGIRARLEIHKAGAGGLKAAKLWVRQRDDLYQLSGEHFPYRQRR